ncbi:Rrf2 family transcriptional regulator [Sinorhizobium fredii]|uniref:Rrf2 family transcriptional regulator n=1 Tax=Rhizobium fredii TaxID=380 RepID=UPI003514264A
MRSFSPSFRRRASSARARESAAALPWRAPATEITVLDVVEAVDGRKALFECREIRAQCALFGDHTPPWAVDGVCAIHAVMIEAEKRTRDALAAHTLASIKGRVATKAPRDHAGRVQEWLAARMPRRGRRAQASQ